MEQNFFNNLFECIAVSFVTPTDGIGVIKLSLFNYYLTYKQIFLIQNI